TPAPARSGSPLRLAPRAPPPRRPLGPRDRLPLAPGAIAVERRHWRVREPVPAARQRGGGGDPVELHRPCPAPQRVRQHVSAVELRRRPRPAQRAAPVRAGRSLAPEPYPDIAEGTVRWYSDLNQRITTGCSHGVF